MIITQQLSMSIATLEEEIVDVTVRLNQAVRQRFSRTPSGMALDFQATSRLDHRLLAGGWYQ